MFLEMFYYFAFGVLLTNLFENSVSCLEWNCKLDKNEAVKLFKSKNIINHTSTLNYNPYKNLTDEFRLQINQTINNHNIVCSIKYLDHERRLYKLQNFLSKNESDENGYNVTHYGKCGACSNLNDLSIYLSGDLTTPVRRCAFLTSISKFLAKKCLINLGFTNECSEVWLYNSLNTKEYCFKTCLISWIKQEPYSDENGNLNNCIQCDETMSGPVFKYFAGRSRRNSGIESEIKRPDGQIFNISHCYY